MSEQKTVKIPIMLDPVNAAAGFLKKYNEANSDDVMTLAEIFRWFEEQGKTKAKLS